VRWIKMDTLRYMPMCYRRVHLLPQLIMHTWLTPYLLMWRIWWAPNNTSGWQIGFNSAFKGLRIVTLCNVAYWCNMWYTTGATCDTLLVQHVIHYWCNMWYTTGATCDTLLVQHVFHYWCNMWFTTGATCDTLLVQHVIHSTARISQF